MVEEDLSACMNSSYMYYVVGIYMGQLSMSQTSFYIAKKLNTYSYNMYPICANVLFEYYSAFHVLVQMNFRQYYFYFLSDQAQILLDHFNVLDELWGKILTVFDNG